MHGSAICLLATIAIVSPGVSQQTATITCTPSRIHLGDTILVSMTKPHGDEFAVNAPGGHWFRIVTHSSDTSGLFKSRIPPEAFALLDTFRISTGSFRAVPYEYGADSMELVFYHPGEYRLDIASDLQTDTHVPVSTCRVQLLRGPAQHGVPPN